MKQVYINVHPQTCNMFVSKVKRQHPKQSCTSSDDCPAHEIQNYWRKQAHNTWLFIPTILFTEQLAANCTGSTIPGIVTWRSSRLRLAVKVAAKRVCVGLAEIFRSSLQRPWQREDIVIPMWVARRDKKDIAREAVRGRFVVNAVHDKILTLEKYTFSILRTDNYTNGDVGRLRKMYELHLKLSK